MRWYNPMSDGELANHWPSTGVDVPSGEQQGFDLVVDAVRPWLVSMADLGGIVQRMRAGEGTVADRLALIDLAGEIETDAPATELVGLADVLRQMAGA